MTEKLYYEDPDLTEFTAQVVRVEDSGGNSDAREKKNGADDDRLVVILDRTAFYPEGGGQPCDLGTLDGLPIVDVQKVDGEIHHLVKLASSHARGKGADENGAGASALQAGSRVTGVVDGERRRDYRQQHTGQHIISAALVRCGGHNTVSVHLGADYSTIEVDSQSVSADDLRAVEALANATIEEAVPVTTSWVSDSEIAGFPLRREPKVSGTIRVVQVGQADCVACGGVHVANSREIRLVRCVGTENIRGHVRLYWKVGDRALADYRMKDEAVRTIGEQLSAQPEEVVERVERVLGQIRDLESVTKKQQERICGMTAESLAGAAQTVGGRKLITAGFHDEEKEFLRGVCKALAGDPDIVACFTNIFGEQIQWSVVAGPSSGVDAKTMLGTLLPAIDGRGGGKPPIWQGIGNRPEGAGQFLATFRELVVD